MDESFSGKEIVHYPNGGKSCFYVINQTAVIVDEEICNCNSKLMQTLEERNVCYLASMNILQGMIRMVKESIVILKSKNRDKHQHISVELLYVIERQIEIECSGKIKKLKRGDIWMVNSEEIHSIICQAEAIYCEIQIDYAWVCNILGYKSLSFDCSKIKENSEITLVQILINQLLNYYVNRKETSILQGNGIFYRLLYNIVKNYSFCDSNYNNDQSERMQKISAYIYTHYNESITMSELAEQFFLSNAYFSRYFKKEFGMSFMEYLNKIRLDRAETELQNTRKSITKIAMECGFSTPSAFNRKFQEAYNLSPKEYRKQNLNDSIGDGVDEQIIDKMKKYYEVHQIEEDNCLSVNEKNIIADVNNVTGNNKRVKNLVNIGAFQDLLKSEIQQHVIVLNRKIGIEYLRLWAPLSKFMITNLDNKESNYNFEQIDKVLDFLIEEGIKPFIDLGNKPKRIQKSAMESVIFEYTSDDIQTLEQWKNIINLWMDHLEERYGKREVEKWYFEMWRDENKSFARENYFELFDITYKCIKNRFDNAQIGGFGIEIFNAQILQKDLEKWKNYECHPDFISIYLFAYEMENDEKKSVKRSFAPNFIERILETLRKSLEQVGLLNIPIYASEWNLTVSDRNMMNDTCARAAYFIHNQIKWADADIALGYFYGSDCLSEYKDSKKLLFGAGGLITKNGIFKPAAYAVKFVNETFRYIVEKGENYLITTDKKGNFDIICENYKQFSYIYYLQEENEIASEEGIFDNIEMLNMHYCLKNMKKGEYEIRRYIVNNEHGSIYDEWKRYHFSTRIGYEDIEYLRHVCVPQILVEKIEVKGSKLDFMIRLAPHEINHLKIKYLES